MPVAMNMACEWAPHAVEKVGQFVAQVDVQVALDVLDHLGRLGHAVALTLDRCAARNQQLAAG